MTLTTEKHLQGVHNELIYGNNFYRVYDLVNYKPSDLTYYAFDDSRTRDYVEKHSKDCDFNIEYNTAKQLQGIDFEYNGVTIDLKVNSNQFHNVFYTLNKRNGIYTFGKPKDSHLIVQIMLGCANAVVTTPASFIEMLVNRTYKYDDLPSDFYDNKQYFKKVRTGLYDDDFVINAPCVFELARNYFAYECENRDMIHLMMYSTPLFQDGLDFR